MSVTYGKQQEVLTWTLAAMPVTNMIWWLIIFLSGNSKWGSWGCLRGFQWCNVFYNTLTELLVGCVVFSCTRGERQEDECWVSVNARQTKCSWNTTPEFQQAHLSASAWERHGSRTRGSESESAVGRLDQSDQISNGANPVLLHKLSGMNEVRWGLQRSWRSSGVHKKRILATSSYNRLISWF